MSLSTALISVDLVAFRLSGDHLQFLAHRQTCLSGIKSLVLPAGRIEPTVDITLEDTTVRQLKKLTNTAASYFEQVITIGDSVRDSRGWSLTVVYYALLNKEADEVLSSDACWVDIKDGKIQQNMAYDHENLVLEALERLQNKVQYSSLPIHLLPEEFTLSDIRNVFDAILDKSPPMRSIRNRFLKGDLLEDTGRQRRGSNRPASLYTINHHSKTWLFDRLYKTTQQ